MSDTAMFWPKLAVASLAVWRLTHLLAYEDGPADLVARGRAALGHGFWGRLLDCFQCLSLFVAAPVAWWVTGNISGSGFELALDTLLVWLAVSGAACLCERIGQPEVVMHTQGDDDGMLRTKA